MQVERNGKPMSALLQQISSQTGGRSRKLDMGSAKAAAQHVNGAAVQGLLDQVKDELDLCKEFEVAYAKRLNLEHSLGTRGPGTSASVRAPANSNTQTIRIAALPARQGTVKCNEESALQQNKRRPALKIPTIASTSNLLRGTTARRMYRDALLAGEDRTALVNDVSSRSSGYPAQGPGVLKQTTTPIRPPGQSHSKISSRSAQTVLNNGSPAFRAPDSEQRRNVHDSNSSVTRGPVSGAPGMPKHEDCQQGADKSSGIEALTQSDQAAVEQGSIDLSTVRALHMDFSIPHADLMRALYKIDS